MINLKEHQQYPFSIITNTCFLLLCMAFSQAAQAQCTQAVTHLAGTVQIGCTSVTVTSAGETGSQTACGIGPYWPGDGPSGSFTFTFSPPVAGVSIDLNGINNWTSYAEEVEFTVNGTFYPITVPGMTSSCAQLCVILPNGRVSTPGGNGIPCAWEDQPIIETISTLTITNVVTLNFPAGSLFSLRFCEQCCATDAGVLAGGPLQLCLPQSASLAPATQTNLEPDDLLQYILYTDANDPEGSIVAMSNTSEFAFNPATMQVGVTYYVAAMAGNDVNGNVDLNDPCLDFSNAIEVEWNPQPTVSFAAANSEVCAGDCLNFDVTFTGTPPFSLTYTAGAGTQTQTFNTNVGTLQICVPAGTLPGFVILDAVSLSDANCVCD